MADAAPSSRLRAWRRLAAIALLLAFYLPPHGLWRLVGASSPWPRRFLSSAARAAGADVRIVGTPLRGPVLYAANHLSWLDILVLAGATGTRFVAKGEVEGWPLIGWLATLNRTIFVARAERGRVQEQAEALRIALGETQPVTLFPEGRTSDGLQMLPFRASLFAAVTSAPGRLQVQPVAIDFGAEAPMVAWPDEFSAGADMMRLMALPGRRHVTLHFCTPIDPALLPDRKAVAAMAQARVAEALGRTALGGKCPSGV